jgi:chromosome condensin MukBEF ATPase and DNA-binding subunit MukB
MTLSEQGERLSALEERVANVKDDVADLKKDVASVRRDVTEIKDILTQAKGGWRVLVVIGGLAGSMTTAVLWLIGKIWPFISGLPR